MITSSKKFLSLDYAKISKGIMLLSSVVVLCLVVYYASFNDSAQFLSGLGISSSYGVTVFSSRTEPVIHDEYYELRKDLKAVATKDKTVIVATLNEAWAAPGSIFDLFLESFRIGNNTTWLLNHMLVIAVDDKAYTRCQSSVSYCYYLKTNSSSQMAGQADFMSANYLDIIWQRLALLHTILKLGYNFINTDTDVMWFRNPLPHFNHDSDFQTSCDDFNGVETDLENHPNVGLMFVRSNNRTIKFYEFWVSSRRLYPRLHEQNAFNRFKNGPIIKEIGLKVRFLDTNYFGGFCSPIRDINTVYTVHANCCVGLKRKIADLRTTIDDWNEFRSSDQTKLSNFNWRAPQKCQH